MLVKEILGVEIFHHDSYIDERGSFQRIFDRNNFLREEINFLQSSLSINEISGTIRCLHFQAKPSQEWKYITFKKNLSV
jgi:dTDP-4-dehydrorhamnose 3,5-epimerase-like enzyme